MRSAVIVGLLVLAGCDTEKMPKDEAEKNLGSTSPAVEASSESPWVQPTVTVTLAAGAEPANWKFRVSGTEPFWSIVADEKLVSYSTPENPGGTIVEAATSWGAQGITDSVTGNVTQFWRGKFGTTPFRLEIQPGKCSDGMSDTVYPLSAKLVISTEVRSGCARPQ